MNKHFVQNTTVIAAAIGAAIASIYLSTNWFSTTSEMEMRERCYGIVRTGKNDCATAVHSCAAQATVDRAPDEFIMLPKGMCQRITGGRIA
jgi:uncharacterized membrane protein